MTWIILTLRMLPERTEYVTFTILNFPTGSLSFNFTCDYIMLNILSVSFCNLYIIELDSVTFSSLNFIFCYLF